MATKKTAGPAQGMDAMKDVVGMAAEPMAALQETSRQMAEKGLETMRSSYEQMKQAAEGGTAAMEQTFRAATDGARQFNLKAIEALRSNMNATLDLMTQLSQANSMAAAIELQTTHARQQAEAMMAQAKEMAEIARQMATDVTEPMKAVAEKMTPKA